MPLHTKGLLPRLAPLALLALLFAPDASAPAAAGVVGEARRADLHAPVTDLILKEPYLRYTGENTRMKIVWQLSATAVCTLQWGADTTYALGTVQTTEYGSDHQHAYTIAGLAPDTKYYYRVLAPDVPYAGSFRTAPAASATELTFFAYGDTRSDPVHHNLVAGAILAECAADSSRQTLVVATGDLVLHGDSETDWTVQFFSPAYRSIRGLMANLPFQSAKGNHEESGALFVKYFPDAYVSGRYWSFDYGPAHFTIVDQYTPYTPGTAQLQWISGDLATSDKRWKFLVLHEPGWSAGGDHENNPTVQAYLQPLCRQYGVSIVFGGHNHYYARAMVDGVAHLTTGGGGAPLYQPNPDYPDIVACASAYHYCRIMIQEHVLTCEAITPAGDVLDSFTMQAPASVPDQGVAAPGQAMPNPFTSKTVIRWRTGNGKPGHLVILDVAGRLVRTLPLGGAGWQAVPWDGTDDAGRRLGSGLYFYREEPRAGFREGKVFLVR